MTGTAVKPDGTQGSPLTITRVSVPLRPGQLVVLTGEGAPTIQVSGADLKPGLSAILTLTFSSGVTRTITVPVMSAADPIYATVMPRTATAQPSGTATPAP